MCREIPYSEIIKNVREVKPYHWINRNLTVLATGNIGLNFINIVRESGYNGELTESGVLIYTQRGDHVSESTL